jgi:hypothetical protein
MKLFFERRYAAAQIAPAAFARSKYCFRHPGRAALAQLTGHSHTIKVITAHINHIDVFRRRLLRTAPIDEVESRRINERLVSRIRNYVQLFSQAPDREIAMSFATEFERGIRAIAESGYEDKVTPIDIPDFSGIRAADRDA